MPVDLWIRRERLVLLPANDQARALITSVPDNRWTLASIRKPRNLQHHRKWMALLSAVFPHQDTWPTFESFRKAVQCAIGHGTMITAKDGRRYMEADSISFAAMDQDAFEEFYERGVDLILTRILPGVGSADLNHTVENILKGYE